MTVSDRLDSTSDQDKDKLEQAIALLSSISGGTSNSTSPAPGVLAPPTRLMLKVIDSPTEM